MNRDRPNANWPEESAPPRKAGGRSRSRVLWRVAGLCAAALVVLLALVALLPTLLSTASGRGWVLSRVNKRLNGKLAIGGWSLGWFSPIRVREMRLSDSAGQPVVEVKGISVPRGLAAFLGSSYDLGEVGLDSPRVYIVLNRDGTTNLERIVQAPSPSVRPPVSEKPARPLGFEIRGHVALKDGEVTITPEGQKPFIVRDLNIAAVVEGLDRPIRIQQTARLGENRAPMDVTAAVLAVKDGRLSPRDVHVEATLNLDGLDLDSLSGLLAFYGVPLRLGGIITTNQEARIEGIDSIRARGHMSITGLQTTGPALEGDTIRVDSLRWSHDLVRDRDTITINDLRLDSTLARLQARGNVTIPGQVAVPGGSLEAEGEVALAAVAAQLPHLLKLRQDVAISSGKAVFRSSLRGEGNTQRIDADLRIEDLSGVRGERRFSIEAPIVLAVKGALDGGQPSVEELRLTSSFCNLSGSGSLEKFRLDLAADLAAATSELSKFVDIGDRRAAGSARLTLAVGARESARDIAAEMKLSRLSVEGFSARAISLPELTLALNAVAPGVGATMPDRFENVALAFDAPFAKGNCGADRIVPGAGIPQVSGGRLDVQADLGDLMAFLRQLAPVPQGLDVSGRAALTADAAVSEGVVSVGRFHVALSSFDLGMNGKHFRDPKLELSGSAVIGLESRSIRASDVALVFGPGTIAVARAEVPDWSRAPQGISVETSGTLDAARLLDVARDFVSLPQGSSVGGKVDFSLAVGFRNQRQDIESRVTLTDVKFVHPSVPPVAEDRVVLEAAGRLDPTGETLELDRVSLASRPLNLAAAASLVGWSGERRLRANGTHEIDLELVSPYVESLTGQKIAMAGRAKEPFSVDMRLDQTDWRSVLREMQAESSLHPSRVSYRGVVLENAELPFAVERGFASAHLKGQALRGRVDLPLTLDVRDGPGLVTVPGEVTILDGLTLTDDLARELIALVSPVFNRAVVIGGVVGYESRRFRLPLGPDWEKGLDFEGTLVLDDVALASSGFTQSLFALMGMEPVAIALPDQRVAIAMKDGRVEQGPLVLRLHDYAVRLSGVFTPKGAVSMIAEVPVTPGMLRRFFGKEGALDALKGEVLRVPIEGTISVPVYAERLVRENVIRLLRSAIGAGKFGVGKGLDLILGRERKEEPEGTK